jgi:histidine triad (HIT) family protein
MPLTIGRVTAWNYTGNDFYCDLAIPHASELEVVFQDEHVLAYHHTRPFWPTHSVVVPKRHLDSLTTVTADDERDIRALFSAVQRVACDVEATKGAAGVLTNLGEYQDSKHLHIHVYSGQQLR